MDKMVKKYFDVECGTNTVSFRIPIRSALTDEEWEYGICRKLRPLGWSVTLPWVEVSAEIQYAPSASKGLFGASESMYLYPMEVSGWASESSRDAVLDMLEAWEKVKVVRDCHFDLERERGYAVHDGGAFVKANRRVFEMEAVKFFENSQFEPKMAAEFVNSLGFTFTDWEGNKAEAVHRAFAKAIEDLLDNLAANGYLKEIEPTYKPQVLVVGQVLPRYFVATNDLAAFVGMTDEELAIRTAIAKLCRHAADEKRLWKGFYDGYPYLGSLDWEIKLLKYGDFAEEAVLQAAAEMLADGIICDAYPKAINRKVDRVTLAEF